MSNPMNVTTGEVRFSYEHLTKTYTPKGGQEQYSVTCLLPKSDTATKARIDAAIEAAKQEGIKSKWGGKLPVLKHLPIYDADNEMRPSGEPFEPECKGCWVFTVKCYPDRYKPEIVDQYNNPIISPAEVYSGMYGRVNFNVYAYSNIANGIGFGLGPVQKLRDGEPLGGSPLSAASAFGDPVSDPSSML